LLATPRSADLDILGIAQRARLVPSARRSDVERARRRERGKGLRTLLLLQARMMRAGGATREVSRLETIDRAGRSVYAPLVQYRARSCRCCARELLPERRSRCVRRRQRTINSQDAERRVLVLRGARWPRVDDVRMSSRQPRAAPARLPSSVVGTLVVQEVSPKCSIAVLIARGARLPENNRWLVSAR